MIPEEKKILFINFSSEINPITSETLVSFITQKLSQKYEIFYILLSSPGGNVMNGITIFNFLRSLPIKIITHNIGIVDSVANIIFLAGEERFAVPNSSFLFHGVGVDITQPSRLEEKQLKELLLGVERDQNIMTQIIIERTKLKKEEIHSMFYEARTLTPQEAQDVGIIHAIKPVAIPEGAEVISFNFPQRPWR